MYDCLTLTNHLLQVIQSFVIPIVKLEGDRLRVMIEGATLHSADKIAAQSIKQAFVVCGIFGFSAYIYCVIFAFLEQLSCFQ